MVEGRRRWVERMNTAKAAGLIERFPNGRRRADLPKLPADRRLRRAVRIVEKEMAARKAEKAALPVLAQRPWGELDKASKLSEATDQSLDNAYAFLCRPIDPVGDPKLFALQQTVGLTVISAQIRLDSAGLMAKTALHDLPDEILRQRLAAAFARLDAMPDVIENDDVGAG
jgi:hypothetical protein